MATLMERRIPTNLLIAALWLCLLSFPPFVATLELHHQLGEADEDGHQHSATDLCSWVQSHASSSVVDCAHVLVSQWAVSVPETPHHDRFVSHLFLIDLPTRAPPSQPS
jgi:hypothetical protein